MFESARLKLTGWYLLIILTITILFSSAFYQASTQEIQRLINRIEIDRQLEEVGAIAPMPRGRNMPTVEELKELKARALFSLFILNGIILVFAGGASYFLAGRTLRPIKLMMDEQNIFISNASHELRTPIATLRAEMEAKLLEKHIDDKNARALIQSNLEELSTLQEVTNSLLRITQVHALNEKKIRQEIPLQQLLNDAEKKVAALAKQKKIKIKTDTTSARVIVNPQEITECFVIILDNAIKYSDQKSMITLTTKLDGKCVLVSIADTGAGIPEKDIPHIFTRFYRADVSRSQTNGYGLGLSIAHAIISSHKGSITVSSVEGTGSTFTIRLPIS